MPQAPFRRESPQPEGNDSEASFDEDDGSISNSDIGDDDDDDDPSGFLNARVLNIHCTGCDSVLSERGMRVFLVAEPETSLYSTDIPSPGVREGGDEPIPTCACAACKLHCTSCEAEVGYHVLRPCSLCSSAGHNGHFWLFSKGVSSAPRGSLVWSSLPYNGASSEDAAADNSVDACLVCASAPMWRPTRVPCGHVFCFGCISREIDMRGQCPLDRIAATRAQLQAVDVDG
jgi:hypothetical protein